MWASQYPCIWFRSNYQNWKCGEILNFLFMLVRFKFHFDRKFVSIPQSASPFSNHTHHENGEADGDRNKFSIKMVFESNQKFRTSPHSQFLVAGTKPHARVLASSHKELHIYNHVATNPIKQVVSFTNYSCKDLFPFPI